MKIVKKLEELKVRVRKDNKLALIIFGIVIATFLVPYLTIPVLLIWWFYKKSRFSRKVKVLTTSTIGGLFALLVVWVTVAYSRDAEPHLMLSEPSESAVVQAREVTLKGSYDPLDRKVWVNGKQVGAENGNFETTYQLEVGENKIEISSGNWKRARVNIVVTRELTEEEKAQIEAEERAKAEKEATEKAAKEAEKKAKEEEAAQEKQKREEEAARKKEVQRVKEEEKKAEQNSKPFAEEFLTEASVKKEIEKLDGSRTMSGKEIVEVKIVENLGTDDVTDDNIVIVTYKPSSVWDEKHTVSTTADTMVAVSEKLFKHPQVGMVRVTTQGDFTDQYGNTKTENAVRFGLQRTTVEKINWENFKKMVFIDYNSLIDIADEQWMHAAVKKYL